MNAPAPPGTVPVTFRAPEGTQLHVSANGAQAAECSTPCTLNLSPGRTSLAITGDFSMIASIDVPARPATVELHHRKTGLAVAGAVLMGIALIDATIVGINNSSDMTAAQADANLKLAIGGLVLAVAGAICFFTSGHDEAIVGASNSAHLVVPTRPKLAFRGVDVAATPHGATAFAQWSF